MYKCSEPGVIAYNSTYNLMQFCDGVNWVAMGSCETIPEGLLLHYNLDETAGTNANDSSTMNFDGTLTNGPVWQGTSGVFDGALQFDGTNDFVSAGNVLNMGTGNDVSVSAWVKSSAALSGITTIAAKGGWGAPGYRMQLSEGRMSFSFGDSGTGNEFNIGDNKPQVNDGRWHHLVWTLDRTANEVKGYLDSVLLDTVAVTVTGNLDNANPFYVGRNDGGGYFAGTIDDFRVYDRVLSPAEVATLNDLGNIACVPTVNNKVRYDNTTSLATYTMTAYAVPEEKNRILVVTAHAEDAGTLPTSVTFDGIALTKATDRSNGSRTIAMWYLLNPPAKSANVVVNYSGPTGRRASIVALTLGCVKQQAPEVTLTASSPAGGTTFNDNITTVSNNAIVLLAVTENQPVTATVTQGPDQKMIDTWTVGGATGGALSYRIVPTAGTTTLGYTWSGASGDQVRALAGFAAAE